MIMKELSIEEKAKRYDESLERARKFATDLPNGRNDRLYHVWDLESIFPELIESEDKRMIKSITRLVKAFYDVNFPTPEGFERKDIFAWLKKRSKQETNELDILSAKKGDILSNGTIVLIVDSIEEFEGKPIINSWYFTDSEKFYGKGTSKCDRWEVDGFRTATKAECNYLLKMMSDAGYVWDINKLELMEIEQTPAWNEEDENHIIGIMQVIDGAIKYNVVSHKTGDMQINWLKSLKDRFTWKPSEDQMNILFKYAEQNNYDGSVLTSLYQDLKKIKG